MGLASRNILDANVHFYGDVKGNDAALEEHDIRAWVDAPEGSGGIDGAGIDPIALLPPLVATSTLYLNARAAPHFLDPLNAALRGFAEELLESEDKAREAGSIEELQFAWVKLPTPDTGNVWSDFSTEALLGVDVPIPKAISETEGRALRKSRLSLMQLRNSGNYWGRTRAPSRGGQAYFANSALVLLIQHIANTRDYERAVVPMAAGLSTFIALVDVAEDQAEIDEDGWKALGRKVYKFNEPINEVVLADDPRQELQNFTEES